MAFFMFYAHPLCIMQTVVAILMPVVSDDSCVFGFTMIFLGLLIFANLTGNSSALIKHTNCRVWHVWDIKILEISRDILEIYLWDINFKRLFNKQRAVLSSHFRLLHTKTKFWYQFEVYGTMWRGRQLHERHTKAETCTPNKIHTYYIFYWSSFFFFKEGLASVAISPPCWFVNFLD